MKLLSKLILGGMCAIVAAGSFASSHHKSNGLRHKTMKQFELCNVADFAKQLSSQSRVGVRFVQDHDANYNYYLATTHAFNADMVRGAACHYINEHKCYMFWGNVANIAMFASHPAPRFPLDSSPHYMISPIITCNAKHFKHHHAKK